MGNDELLSELRDFVAVAGRVWLGRAESGAEAALTQQHWDIARQKRRDRLALVSSRLQQVDELDARVELIEMAENLPHRDRWLAQLRDLRESLLSKATAG